jgi:hypothetical protein
MSKKTFIQFLIEDGITYIYNPDAPKMYMCYSNDKWVETNTTHMEWLFREYHSNRFFGRNYTMILKINEETNAKIFHVSLCYTHHLAPPCSYLTLHHIRNNAYSSFVHSLNEV